MKEIFILTQYFPPETAGRASRIHELGKFLNKFHHVTIISPPPTLPFTKFEKAKYRIKKEKLYDLDIIRIGSYQPTKKSPSFFQRLRYTVGFPIFATLYLLRNSKKFSTIIISTPPSPVLLAALAARIQRKKIIIDIGDLWETHEGLDPSHKFMRKLMKKFEINSWKHADLIITNHKILKDRIIEILGSNFISKVQFLPYQVDLELFKNLGGKVENQLIYTGNYGYFYNFEALLESLRIVLKKFSELKMQFYGRGEESTEKKLLQLTSELGLSGCCEFHSPVPKEELPEILSKSQVGIIPILDDKSGHHIFPTKTYEYMACGIPIFAFGPSGELQRILMESNSGVFIEGNDSEKIAQSLIEMLNNKQMLEIYSKNGRKFVERIGDFSHITEVF